MSTQATISPQQSLTAACVECRKRKPVTEFRFRSKSAGIRMKQCRDCRRALDRKRRGSVRERLANERAAAAYAALAKSRSLIDAQRAVEATVRQLGGPEEFGARLGQYIFAELSHPVASRKRLAFNAACRLISLSTELEKQAERAVVKATAATERHQ